VNINSWKNLKLSCCWEKDSVVDVGDKDRYVDNDIKDSFVDIDIRTTFLISKQGQLCCYWQQGQL